MTEFDDDLHTDEAITAQASNELSAQIREHEQ